MAGDVKVKVGADTTQLTTGLKTASASVDAFAGKTNVASTAMSRLKTTMTTAGVAGQKAMAGLKGSMGQVVVAMGALMGIKSLFDEAGRINDLSVRFGTSAESMQRMKYAAEQSGTSLETLAKAMNRGEIAAAQAAKGNKQMQEAFAALGISAQEFADMSVEERMIALGDAYDTSSNKAQTFEAMTRLLGKATTELIPLFGAGAESIRAMMDEAIVASNEAIDRMDVLGDKAMGVWSNFKSLAMSGIGMLVDGLQRAWVFSTALGISLTKVMEGPTAMKEAFEDTLYGGIEFLNKAEDKRTSRAGSMTRANIVEMEIDQSEEDAAKAAQKYADTVQKISEEARAQMARNRELDAQDAAKKAEEVAKIKKDAELEAMGEKVNAADEEMRRLSGAESNMPQADALRRIGGGFANSNYGQLSREAMLITKQVDYASKQLDELKKIVTELRKSDPLGGVTS